MPENMVKGFNVNGSTVQYDYESLSDRLLKSSIGEIYSSSNTYKVDEYVLYAGQLYRCIVEVTTPQNFDSSKWEAVSVGDDLKYIKKYYCIDDGIKQALLNLLSHVAYTDEHGQDYYDELEAELFRTADLVSISAVFNQGQNVIYDTDSLDTLRQYLVVTATYDDSSTGTVTGYTLSGTLTVGTSTVTVSYGGKTATFDVTVTSTLLFHAENVYVDRSGDHPAINTGIAILDEDIDFSIVFDGVQPSAIHSNTAYRPLLCFSELSNWKGIFCGASASSSIAQFQWMTANFSFSSFTRGLSNARMRYVYSHVAGSNSATLHAKLNNNTVSVQTISSPFLAQTPGTKLMIGGAGGTAFNWIGTVTSCKVYRRVLTQTEINEFMA